MDCMDHIGRVLHVSRNLHRGHPNVNSGTFNEVYAKMRDAIEQTERKAAAFDALVEAVERADLECRKPQTVTGVRRGLHTLTCLEGYDAGMPCPPCALRAALASAKEAVEGSDGG